MLEKQRQDEALEAFPKEFVVDHKGASSVWIKA
jgi:hypothetical protein